MDGRGPLALTPDLCVVGAGTPGLAVATAAGALGVPTVLVDKDDLERALPRAGDVGRQFLIAAARARMEALRSAAFGLAPGSSETDWPSLRRAAISAAEMGAPEMSARRLAALGVHVIRAAARFTDKRTLQAGTVSIRARRFVLCTGATPAMPALAGLDRIPVLTARSVLDVAELPRRLLVLGAGSTGLELAQIFRRLGSEVVVLDAGTALRDFDPELAAVVLTRLEAEGIRILQNVTALRIEPDAAGVRLFFRDAENEAGPEAVEAGSHLLVATGWRPNVAGLGLDAAAIRCDPSGVAVAPNGRTSNERVFAAGDVVGLGRSMQSAQAQAETVLRAALFRQPVRLDPRSVPRILRTDPEIAVVGLSEAQARERVRRTRVLRWPLNENARARAEGRTSGHAKVITTRNGRLLGAGIVGAEASETIGVWTLAIARGLKAGHLAALPLPNPGYADLSRRAAASALMTDLGGPWVRRALRLVRMLG